MSAKKYLFRIVSLNVKLLCGMTFCLLFLSCAAHRRETVFSNPQLAVLELKDAIASMDKSKSAAVLGSGSEYLFETGDAALNTSRAKLFTDKFNEFHDLEKLQDDQYRLVIGANRWPFPVPLVLKDGEWFFDFEEGKQAIQDRITGSNELTAISVLETIYYAQKEFYQLDLNQNQVADYAAKIISSPGKTDGLYWNQTDEIALASPLSELFSQAAADGYDVHSQQYPKPYKGYYFKVLKSEDSAKFQAFAYPAVWGNSGYMSFIINEKGWVYQKSLAENFDSSSINIDQSWERIQ